MAPEVTNILSEARPTELLLLVATPVPSLHQLLRITFLELLRQRVLVLEKRPLQPHPKDPVTWASYVLPGPTLPTYLAREYELLLLRPFLTHQHPQLLLRHFVQLTYQRALTGSHLRNLMRRSGPLAPLYQDAWWRRLLHLRPLTPAGEQQREQVRQALEHHDRQLHALVQDQPAAAAQRAARLGGLIFLLPIFQSPIGQQLDQELYRQWREQQDDAGWLLASDSGGDGGGLDTWSGHGHDFDAHADSHGHHGDGGDGGSDGDSSGCGGDSGCGGSSGCGGCGGGD